MALLANTTLLV